MFITVLFVIAKVGNSPNVHQQVNEYTNYRHAMKYYSAIKRDELLMYVPTWENLITIMLNERRVYTV